MQEALSWRRQGHVTRAGDRGIKQAVLAGIHSIEHGIFLTDEVIELMIKNGTYLVPTILARHRLWKIRNLRRYCCPSFGRRQSRVTSTARILPKRIRLAKIAMGTDAGVMPHGTNLREVVLLTEIGMSPMEAILVHSRSPRNVWSGRIRSAPWKLASWRTSLGQRQIRSRISICCRRMTISGWSKGGKVYRIRCKHRRNSAVKNSGSGPEPLLLSEWR